MLARASLFSLCVLFTPLVASAQEMPKSQPPIWASTTHRPRHAAFPGAAAAIIRGRPFFLWTRGLALFCGRVPKLASLNDRS